MGTSSLAVSRDKAALVRPGERTLYAVVLAVSLLIYGGLLYAAMEEKPEVVAVVIFYGGLLALLAFLGRGLALGRLRGSAILVSPKQLPLLHSLATTHAQKLGMAQLPAVYVIESGGLLNAFATRFLGRDFVIVHSDVLDLALQQGEAAVGFVVAHELGHVWRGHLKYRWLTLPGRIVPYLGAAYSRACEYTCDQIGAYCQPDGAIYGLLALAAGKQLYTHIDPREFAAQAETDKGFWIRRAELMASHPRLPKRVAALL